MPKNLPSLAEVSRLFRYDKEAGHLIWQKSGKRAGSLDKSSGYRHVKINGTKYREHRIIWLLMTCQDPAAQDIDHINRCRADNRWENLRLASRTENNLNRSDVKGYCYRPRKGKYSAQIMIGSKQKHLGYYDDAESARAAYVSNVNNLATQFSEINVGS